MRTVYRATDETEAERHAWALLCAARQISDEWLEADASTVDDRDTLCGLRWHPQRDHIDRFDGVDARAEIRLSFTDGWSVDHQLSEPTRDLLELYLPVLGSPRAPSMVIAHLGQSIDSRIATDNGDAFFVTGEENRKHLHRLRSLCQAVLVGAGTVAADDPQLTTRAVEGESPIRVIVDPRASLPQSLKVIEDGDAPTWLLHDEQQLSGLAPLPTGCRRLGVELREGDMQVEDMVRVLSAEGVRRVFVEGGGVTVSRFLMAGCLDRLQIAIAPVLVGQGVPALQIPGAKRMLDALRPAHRVYRMGEDILWDFTLSSNDRSARSSTAEPVSAGGPATRLLWGHPGPEA